MAEPLDEEFVIPSEITELTEISYANWLHHPVTRAFRMFMRDAREAMKKEHIENWEHGKPVDPIYDAKAQARVEQFEELLELSVADIHRPYGFVPASNEKTEKAKNEY